MKTFILSAFVLMVMLGCVAYKMLDFNTELQTFTFCHDGCQVILAQHKPDLFNRTVINLSDDCGCLPCEEVNKTEALETFDSLYQVKLEWYHEGE